MKKKYIRLNIDDNHLSLGNFFRIIKEISKNKSAALQSELFSILFPNTDANDTTINNYCVGIRGIGNDYKQYFISKEKKYIKNNAEFLETICQFLNVIEGRINKNVSINEININANIKQLCDKMYNIAKNDAQISNETLKKIEGYYKSRDYYSLLCQVLLFIILDKKQPIYEEDLKKEVIENILKDSSISAKSLEEYLSLKLKEGINYDYAMKKLADKGNAYANFELGANEFYGYTFGTPRYAKAISYLKEAAELNHANANYIIGRIYTEGLIGSKTNEELEIGYNYFIKAESLGNIAALNNLGIMYYNGIYPCKKNIAKAISYFKKASEEDYVFAYNNLGKYEEDNNNLEKAYMYYQKSADLGESWACNKMGEYYRLQNDYERAYFYYQKSLDTNKHTLCYYAYYNLAKYYYLYGNNVIAKDEELAQSYLEIASLNNIFEAAIELFFLLIKKYLNNKNEIALKKIQSLKLMIENNEKYTNDFQIKITNELEKIKTNKEIDISWLTN